jgi:hypothetical protein
MTTLLSQTVQLVRGPLSGLGAIDLVVIREEPYTYRPAPWVEVPSTMYELHWPDGGTTWHSRHEFEPIGQ